jgi:2-polyprenyl-3-methyl-5-hydroxy-6-metoxy-1,4-benzoquinol methylase
MTINLKEQVYAVFSFLTQPIARARKSYFFEDYRRVYPDGLAFYPFKIPRKATKKVLNNFKNHQKFYRFAGQFVSGKKAIDVGCGSGHGCEILKRSGASEVFGCDVSEASVEFAKKRFADCADFCVQGITDMTSYPDGLGDVVMSSEVLEHIKEYGKEKEAIREMKRITKRGGLVIVATPNSEILGSHGFYFDEIAELFAGQFSKFCIFENAFVPFDAAGRAAWEKRLQEHRVGIVVSERINLEESVIPRGTVPELKSGLAPGKFAFEGIQVDTALLHNTHSWIVLAINEN